MSFSMFWRVFLVSAALLEIGAQAPNQPASQTDTNRPPRRGGGRDPKMDAYYKLGPDSMPQEGVPKGRFDGPKIIPSEIFPGTQHTYSIYVPAQYDPSKPAALIIFNDGQAFKSEPGDVQAHHVLDNLIYRREIPVMLGVFINPGRRPDQPEPTPQNWGDRDTNRPEEYNALNDKYPRVVVDELLPALRKDYNISPDPEQHAIGGASSGGIAAFTVAWQRPDDFRKVFSFVGSFVNLGNRGGHTYPDLVLQSDKKPLRIYLQDGRNDNRGPGRGGSDPNSYDWFYQNVRMADALTKKGYDLNYTWGIGNHGQKQGGAIFPEIMRWLWRDAQKVSTDREDAVERSFRAAPALSSSSESGAK
jgi:enterochelin esterase-like enzyme